MKRKRVKENPYGIKGIEFETNGRQRTVRCKLCGHRVKATFFKKDPDPNDVAYCPSCEGIDFEFVD
jgi:NAD-dependent SIR2 family protein deacetylase